MIRVKTEDAAVNGRFTDGDPHLEKMDATRVAAYWLNGVQEELVNTVLASGQKLDESKEFQLAAAVRRASGFDRVIDAKAFVGRNEQEQKALKGAGYYKTLAALQDAKPGDAIKVKNLDQVSVSAPIEINVPNLQLIFSPNIVMEPAEGTAEHAFKIVSDGVQMFDVRTKGFKFPFLVDIKMPAYGNGLLFLDRCIASGSQAVTKIVGKPITIQFSSTTV